MVAELAIGGGPTDVLLGVKGGVNASRGVGEGRVIVIGDGEMLEGITTLGLAIILIGIGVELLLEVFFTNDEIGALETPEKFSMTILPVPGLGALCSKEVQVEELDSLLICTVIRWLTGVASIADCLLSLCTMI